MLDAIYSRYMETATMVLALMIFAVPVLTVPQPDPTLSDREYLLNPEWDEQRQFPTDVARRILQLVRMGTGMDIPAINTHDSSLKRSRYSNSYLSQRQIGNEFLGKRTVDNEDEDNNQFNKRMGSEFLGKRMGSEFLGKRMGSEFLGKRMGSEFLGKRMGSEFLGKRMGSEFLGKRMGSEFLGKRTDSSSMYDDDERRHKRQIGSEFLGRRKRDSSEGLNHQTASLDRA